MNFNLEIMTFILTLFYPICNYFIYSYFKDPKKNYESRSSQGVNRFLKNFKWLEKIALILTCGYVIFNWKFTTNSEKSVFFFIIGNLIALSSLVLLFWARREIGINFSPCHCATIPQRLIKTGPYYYFSHPIYLSNILMFISIIILNKSFFLTIPLLILLSFYFVSIFSENRALRENFPNEFPGKFIFKKINDKDDFVEFATEYKNTCTKRGLILNYEPDPKQFETYDKVIGVYKDNKLLGGYILNNFPQRSFQSINTEKQNEILSKIDGSFSEVVGIWHSPEISKLHFGIYIWPTIVWDTLAMDTDFIFGCSMHGHGFKKIYVLLRPTIVVNGYKADDLIVFYYHWSKFLFTFICAFALIVPKILLKKGLKTAKKN